MNNMTVEIVIIILLFKFIMLFYFNKYLLMFLILIEYISFTILTYLMYDNNSWMYLMYLIYSVGEAILWLSLMVSSNYMYGHQKIKLISLIN